tara:strand:+ start:331 stop:1212 length:882 start_codon:yes stop_codon:yes gene_type:complete
MIIKKILSLAASIISLVILKFFFFSNSIAGENNIKYFSKDNGIVGLMYHRFNENKYPSTNIRMEIFKKQMKIIRDSKYEFYDPNKLEKEFNIKKDKKKILISIDDAFRSFYDEAWPYLKENKIPFILFVSTQPVGKRGYMNWDEIREIEKSDFGNIGHHSHTHDYLINETLSAFIKDTEQASEIFLKELGYVPTIYSYPFGEYSKDMKNFISKKFKIAFGQHSGVIDINKDKYELPRFPINEKYGDLKRFQSIINYYPLEYKSLKPEEKKLDKNSNPPKLIVEFFNEQKILRI